MSVLLCRYLPPQAEERIAREFPDLVRTTSSDRAELLANVSGKIGILVKLTDKVDAEFLDAAGPQLKVISTMSVGFDHIDLPACKARNIQVGYTPDVLTDATAELTVALLLATARRFGEALRAPKVGEWTSWSPTWMCGYQMAGKTVGFVGYGRIGQAVARRLSTFKLANVLYSCPSPKQDLDQQTAATHVPFSQLLTESDVVIVTCALNSDTKHLFNSSAFTKMKPTAIFINTARGQIVKQSDLVTALQNKTIAAAGLDVTDPEPLPQDHPLLQLDNALVLPHIGSATIETREAMADLAIENLVRGVRGEPLLAAL
ncbi:glyoxylate reductase [Phlyctochytrium arcticum]|nr:glyoxylate reductase [Phlyctochytrium arcticum]